MGQGPFSQGGYWDGQPAGQVVLRALWGAGWGDGWGRDRTGASAVPSPSHSSLPAAVIDLGFQAQIGFLFGLNSIPHPAWEEAQGLRRTPPGRGQGRLWIGRTDAWRLGAPEQSPVSPF